MCLFRQGKAAGGKGGKGKGGLLKAAAAGKIPPPPSKPKPPGAGGAARRPQDHADPEWAPAGAHLRHAQTGGGRSRRRHRLRRVHAVHPDVVYAEGVRDTEQYQSIMHRLSPHLQEQLCYRLNLKQKILSQVPRVDCR